jgi:hypothetical protein
MLDSGKVKAPALNHASAHLRQINETPTEPSTLK